MIKMQVFKKGMPGNCGTLTKNNVIVNGAVVPYNISMYNHTQQESSREDE